MRTNIEIDDKLMKDALRATGAKTKKEAVELGLRAARWSADATHRRACEAFTNTMPPAVCVEGAALTNLAHALVLVRPNV